MSKLTAEEYSKASNALDKDMRTRAGIHTENYQNLYQNFNRYYNIYPFIEMSNYKSYVFITRPDCNIFDVTGRGLYKSPDGAINLGVDTKFANMLVMHPVVLKSLTQHLSTQHDFIPFLMDRTISMQLQDYTIKNYSLAQQYSGFQSIYAGNAVESTSGGTFDITFREDYLYRVTKFFDTWIYYMDGVTRNKFSPLREKILNKELDYTCSVYFILCEADGANITYFAKYTGCFPLNAPHSNHSHNISNPTPDTEVTVSFAFSDFKALDSWILKDFNQNSRLYGTPVPHGDSRYNTGEEFADTGGFIVGPPYITNVSGYKYLLQWNQILEVHQ